MGPDRPAEIVRTSGPGLDPLTAARQRTPSGHPEGYIEALANLYRCFGRAVRGDTAPPPAGAADWFPGISDGMRTMLFVETAIANSAGVAKWTALSDVLEAAALLAQLDLPAIRLQFDFYHTQIMTGDLAKTFEQHLPITAHVQIAGVPERQEPDIGEINYPYLFDLLDRLGYQGWVGCEYFPAASTEDGLGWALRYGVAPAVTHLATGGERV